MSAVKITLARALTRIKVLEQQITRDALAPMVGVVTGKSKNVAELVERTTNTAFLPNNEPELIQTFKANYDHLQGLLAEHRALKRALTRANATLEINFMDAQYTVLELLHLRNAYVQEPRKGNVTPTTPYMTAYMSGMLTQLDIVERTRLKYQDVLNQTIAQSLPTYQAGAVTSEVEAARKLVTAEIEDRMTPAIVDPCDVRGALQRELKTRDQVLQEINTVLSEFNALTTIEVTW